LPPELDEQTAQRLLEAARWQEASSARYQSRMMAHSYTLRRFWARPQDFDACLAYVRSHGEVRAFGSWDYLELVLGEWMYWNIDPEWPGRGKEWAWLINRKEASRRNYRPRTRRKPEVEQLELF
jgi:hypothetical protein